MRLGEKNQITNEILDSPGNVLWCYFLYVINLSYFIRMFILKHLTDDLIKRAIKDELDLLSYRTHSLNLKAFDLKTIQLMSV